ncbi:hypothetical protein [Streptomyces caatingaensis]|uniref:Integral membrane protein n=1 Tax=Streptomyces caatingaensis TaxID=1678637 RepID=A0A0K9XNW0_9ACTN|nr:hypothetical protein [Streptomyces caatingaensis]KNB54392.1 hypothetical protein AC230_00480 [Streptomyces caatingaensis]
MIVVIRVVIVAITVLTVFLMSWIPVLRVAIVRRRGKDWALFWTVLVVSVGCLVMMEERFSKTTNSVGLIAAICVGSLSIAYYLWADIRHFRPAAPAAAPGGYAPPYAVTLPAQPQPQPGSRPEPFPGAGPGGPGAPQPGPYPSFAPPPPYPGSDTPVPGHQPGLTVPGQGAAPYGQPGGCPPQAQPVTGAPPAVPQPGYGYPHVPEGAPRDAARQAAAGHRTPERIRQVRAELDELSDLLRKEAGEQRERGR